MTRGSSATCVDCARLLRSRCTPPLPPGCHRVVVATDYNNEARQLVAALKYRKQRPVANVLADHMVAAWLTDVERTDVERTYIERNDVERIDVERRPVGVRHTPVDLVTWAPTTPDRRRDRGFDQAELLARRVAERLSMPAKSMLERPNGGGHQTGKTADERRSAVGFRLKRGREIRGLHVLLIDDVMTTGSTLSAAAFALSAAGAVSVSALCAAYTPQIRLRRNQ